MTQKNLKKLVAFSSEQNKRAVENIIRDMAVNENRSIAVTTENVLLDALLPKAQPARDWVYSYYCGKISFGKMLSQAFYKLSSGNLFHLRFHNGRPLVEFLLDVGCHCGLSVSNNDEHLYRLYLSLFDSCVNRLEFCFKNWENLPCKDFESDGHVRYFKELYRIAEENPEISNPSHSIRVILNFWEFFKDWQIPYIYFGVICEMIDEFTDIPVKFRLQAISLFDALAQEWNEISKKEDSHGVL